MTIAVAVATPDGVVLAADSRATFTDGERHRITSDSAQKVFHAGHMGVAVTGSAFIGPHTIAGTMDRFIAQSDARTFRNFDRFLAALGSFFNDSFQQELKANKQSWDTQTQGFPIAFLVAGYGDDGIGHVKELLIPGPEVGDFSADTVTGGTMWRGQTDVISRLLNGVDWEALAATEEPLSEELTARLQRLGYVSLAPITVADAVDYATFLIRTTIDMQRFSDGTAVRPGLIPGCGGSIHALVVERSSVWWASRSTRAHWEQVEQ